MSDTMPTPAEAIGEALQANGLAVTDQLAAAIIAKLGATTIRDASNCGLLPHFVKEAHAALVQGVAARASAPPPRDELVKRKMLELDPRAMERRGIDKLSLYRRAEALLDNPPVAYGLKVSDELTAKVAAGQRPLDAYDRLRLANAELSLQGNKAPPRVLPVDPSKVDPNASAFERMAQASALANPDLARDLRRFSQASAKLANTSTTTREGRALAEYVDNLRRMIRTRYHKDV